mgnify:CR=1 FL=1
MAQGTLFAVKKKRRKLAPGELVKVSGYAVKEHRVKRHTVKPHTRKAPRKRR